MTKYTDLTELSDVDEILISDEMSDAINKWKMMYKDRAPWVNDDVTSIGIPKSICQMLQMMVLSELEVEVQGNESKDSLASYMKNIIDEQKDGMK